MREFFLRLRSPCNAAEEPATLAPLPILNLERQVSGVDFAHAAVRSRCVTVIEGRQSVQD
jgi:hypothetical protein